MEMIETVSQIEDLYRYNDWGNARVFQLCKGLTNAQLDETREMGFSSLRNTLFHILTAEQIWLERWQLVPWRSFPTDSQGMAIEEIEALLRQVSQSRLQMIRAEEDSQWQRIVKYKDSRGHEYANPLDVLLLHVANHSTYHRAQALAYLKSFGRSVPVGIDYSMYKLARPTVEQDPDSAEKFRQFGLQVATAPGWNVHWDGQLMQRYFEYGHWATLQILDTLEDAAQADLDRDFGFGHSTLRKTLVHMLDVEAWWASIFAGKPDDWHAAGSLELSELRPRFQALYSARREQVSRMNDASAQEILVARPAGVPMKMRVVEALVQLCCHGTHHRAQLVNMARHIQRPVPASDLVAWWRQQPA